MKMFDLINQSKSTKKKVKNLKIFIKNSIECVRAQDHMKLKKENLKIWAKQSRNWFHDHTVYMSYDIEMLIDEIMIKEDEWTTKVSSRRWSILHSWRDHVEWKTDEHMHHESKWYIWMMILSIYANEQYQNHFFNFENMINWNIIWLMRFMNNILKCNLMRTLYHWNDQWKFSDNLQKLNDEINVIEIRL